MPKVQAVLDQSKKEEGKTLAEGVDLVEVLSLLGKADPRDTVNKHLGACTQLQEDKTPAY